MHFLIHFEALFGCFGDGFALFFDVISDRYGDFLKDATPAESPANSA